MASTFLNHPRRLWWRGLLFQVHLWVGLFVALYICVIGISGSILVFQSQLYRFSRPELFQPLSAVPSDLLPLTARYLEIAAKEFPEVHVSDIYFPDSERNVIQLEADSKHPRFFNDYLEIYLDPASGQVLGTTSRNFWVGWLRELHVRLLAGKTGALINGCGAFCLLVLVISGIVIWWPGIRNWTRALRVDFRRRLPRINFDLHSAIGFWSLLFVFLWAVSGIYFTWPDQFVSTLDFFTPARSAASPEFHVLPAAPSQTRIDLSKILRVVQKSSSMPLRSVSLPENTTSPLVVMTGAGTVFDRSTLFYFNPYTGILLGNWDRAPGNTFGTQLIYWLAPLHFGENWGLAIQIVWCLFGLALPVLAITGAFMYWNRYLGKRVRRFSW